MAKMYCFHYKVLAFIWDISSVLKWAMRDVLSIHTMRLSTAFFGKP